MGRKNKMDVEFKLAAYALKLLGKNLYSNPWSAISELVANGIDAKAKNITIIYDEKKDKIYDLYIIDNGSGMDHEDIVTKYVVIGYKKRLNLTDKNDLVMGRKGIGKLAALFLSNEYDIITKKKDELFYSFDFSIYNENDSELPKLHNLSQYEKNEIIAKHIDSYDTYTCLYIKNVNLMGYGEISFSQMNIQLANLFSYESIKSKVVCKEYKNGKEISSTQVNKTVAFKNMMIIRQFGKQSFIEKSETEKKSVVIPRTKSKGSPIEVQRIIDEPKRFEIDIPNFKKADLEGWIGIHATIKQEDARTNDERFSRNLKVYNPITLRIYVRNKLALNNFFELSHNSQTYANYIEGELHFDILDDDDFPDISTTNRQSIDANDIRTKELVNKVNSIVNDLISLRVEINNKLEKKEETDLLKNKSTAKKNAVESFKMNIQNQFKNIDLESKNKDDVLPEIVDKLTHMMSMQLEGDVEAKSEYKLFFSHKSHSKCFSDLIKDILVELGAKPHEIWYTSDEGRIEDLDKQIRSNIIHQNTMMVYFFSKDFRLSDYPLLETGAGWATKTKDEVLVFSDKSEFVCKAPIFNTDTFILFESMLSDERTRKFYAELTDGINEMVNHLNIGRSNFESTHGVNQIKKLKLPVFPMLADVPSSQNDSDFIDPLLQKHVLAYKDRIIKYLS